MERIDIKHERMINDIIEVLDWKMIMGFYETLNLKWYGKDIIRKNSLEKRNPTIEELQSELRSVCRFVIQKGLSEYVFDQWTILWLDPKNFTEDNFDKKDNFGCQLEVLFTPTRALTFENGIVNDEESKLNQKEMEILIMNSMLTKAVQKEDYELAARIKRKIDEIK